MKHWKYWQNQPNDKLCIWPCMTWRSMADIRNFTLIILIGGLNISNLRFAYDIDLRAGSNKELQILTNWLVESSKTSNGMDINYEKSKKMVNSKRNQKASI